MVIDWAKDTRYGTHVYYDVFQMAPIGIAAFYEIFDIAVEMHTQYTIDAIVQSQYEITVKPQAQYTIDVELS